MAHNNIEFDTPGVGLCFSANSFGQYALKQVNY